MDHWGDLGCQQTWYRCASQHSMKTVQKTSKIFDSRQGSCGAHTFHRFRTCSKLDRELQKCFKPAFSSEPPALKDLEISANTPTVREVADAIRSLKNGNATSIDSIHTEMLMVHEMLKFIITWFLIRYKKNRPRWIQKILSQRIYYLFFWLKDSILRIFWRFWATESLENILESHDDFRIPRGNLGLYI